MVGSIHSTEVSVLHLRSLAANTSHTITVMFRETDEGVSEQRSGLSSPLLSFPSVCQPKRGIWVDWVVSTQQVLKGAKGSSRKHPTFFSQSVRQPKISCLA